MQTEKSKPDKSHLFLDYLHAKFKYSKSINFRTSAQGAPIKGKWLRAVWLQQVWHIEQAEQEVPWFGCTAALTN